jgi:hypothetical protein
MLVEAAALVPIAFFYLAVSGLALAVSGARA